MEPRVLKIKGGDVQGCVRVFVFFSLGSVESVGIPGTWTGSRGECREFPPIPMSTTSIEARSVNELYAKSTAEQNSPRIFYKKEKSENR